MASVSRENVGESDKAGEHKKCEAGGAMSQEQEMKNKELRCV